MAGLEEVVEVEADSNGLQKLKNVAEKSWYGRVEEVEEVEANSKGPQKQHHPSENFCNSLDVFITLYYYL